MQVDGYSLDAQKDKLKKYAEFQDMLCQLTFNLNLSPWHISTKEIKQIRIFENLICHIGIRRW